MSRRCTTVFQPLPISDYRIATLTVMTYIRSATFRSEGLMPTITISTDTYNSLKELAEPLEDSHDSLLKKLMTVYRNQAPPQRARFPSERRRPAEQPGMRAPRGAVPSRPV